jgi:glycerol-3-phosphate acyltransferase PlsX
MAMAASVVATLPGIERPAFCSPLPARNGPCYLLDLGANLDCSAGQLHQFASMGSALAASMEGLASPRVALLNVGAEEIKGTAAIRAAAEAISADPQLNYVGFIEGDQLLSGAADVVVCDGFAGNVALKVCEGTAQLIGERLRERFARGALPRLLGAILDPLLAPLYAELDPRRYNGASLLGLRGVVVKSHGNSSAAAFERAIACAVTAVQQNLPERISQQLRLAAG